MPRKSIAALTTPSVTAVRPRLTAPSSLSTAERSLFNDLINSCDPAHFRASDLPLLISFIQATLLAQKAIRDPDLIAQWEKAVKVQATLATRLRLAPQSRVDPKTLARQDTKNPKLRLPWEDEKQHRQRLLDAGYEHGDE